MWLFFMNMLAQPGRTLRMWVIGIGAAVLLLFALANAGPGLHETLGGILGALMVLVLIRVPMRFVITLMIAAVVIVSAVSLVSEVVSSGYVPLIMIGLGLTFGLSVWFRAGAPGLRVGSLGDLARHVLRGPPRSRGAHWATLRELRRGGFLGAYGWRLGAVEGQHIVRLPVERMREGTLMTGATGSGKTTIVFIPALIEEASLPAAERRHVVVVDPKAELTSLTMPTLALTHRAFVWDPSNPDDCTVGFDPLATLPDQSDERWVGEVKQLAQAYFWATRATDRVTDEFFIMMPRAVMESAFLAFLAMYPRGTFVELADWIRSLKLETFQSLLDQSANPAVRASAETLRALGMSDRSIGPIWGDVLQRFDVLDDPRVRRSMSGPTWSFGPEPIALYLRVAAQDAHRLAPLLSMALGQIYRQLTTAASKTADHRLPREVRVIMDELGNLPRIHGLDVALATLRSAGVGHCMAVQTTAQLTYHYGQKLAETIQDNLVTRIILGPAAEVDAKAFSARCGEVCEYHPSRSWTSHGIFGARSQNFSHSPERRPLVSAAEIIHMKDAVLISTRGIAPIRAAARPYYKDPGMVRRLQEDKLAFEQRVANGTVRGSVSPPAPPPPTVAPDDIVPPAERDAPPPGCTAQEWDAAPASLRVARWSAEDDLFSLVTGRMANLEQIHERWRANPARSTPARYAKITTAERAKAPNVASYVDELALRLQLRHEDDEPPMTVSG